MSNILAPVNFSDASNNAALYAAQLAKDLNMSLILLHVISVPLTIPPVPLPGEMYDDMRRDTMNQLKILADQLQSATDVKAELVVEMGSLGFQIETTIQHYNPRMLVMGISVESATRVFFSSNVFETFKELHVPLLVIGEDVIYTKPERIALAFDFASDTNFHAASIVDYCKQYDARLDVVHVNKKPENVTLVKVQDLKITLSGVNADVHLIDDEIVEAGLHRYLAINKTDQLILLPQDHGFFEFHTSETKRLLWKFNVPIVVMR